MINNNIKLQIHYNKVQKPFHKNLFKIKSNRKKKFIIYHFSVESKSHESIDLLIIASTSIYQTKKRKKVFK